MRHFTREYRGPRNQDSRNRNQDSSRRTVNVEETSSKAMVAIDELVFDWSYMQMMKSYKHGSYGFFTDSEVRKFPDAPLVEELVLDDKLEKKIVFPSVAKMEFVRPKQQEKPVRKRVKLTAITIKGKGWYLGINIQRVIHKNKDQGYVDSGCSRHMTGNMSYLLDFKEFE
ncbi:hypothetical protein Tco_0720145 [Tanacetum coccineum]